MKDKVVVVVGPGAAPVEMTWDEFALLALLMDRVGEGDEVTAPVTEPEGL
jgi:hypothetical protein